jgi:RNA 3'-terminal phosphate cyclase
MTKPAPLHLTASMRVVASHLHMRRVPVAAARRNVLEAAKRVDDESLTPEIVMLVARLEKATGCSIAELAKHAEGWPDDV